MRRRSSSSARRASASSRRTSALHAGPLHGFPAALRRRFEQGPARAAARDSGLANPSWITAAPPDKTNRRDSAAHRGVRDQPLLRRVPLDEERPASLREAGAGCRTSTAGAAPERALCQNPHTRRTWPSAASASARRDETRTGPALRLREPGRKHVQGQHGGQVKLLARRREALFQQPGRERAKSRQRLLHLLRAGVQLRQPPPVGTPPPPEIWERAVVGRRRRRNGKQATARRNSACARRTAREIRVRPKGVGSNFPTASAPCDGDAAAVKWRRSNIRCHPIDRRNPRREL